MAGKRVNNFRFVETDGLLTKHDQTTCTKTYFLNPLTSRWVGRGRGGKGKVSHPKPSQVPSIVKTVERKVATQLGSYVVT